MSKTLIFITGNANKAAQVSQWLGTPVDHLKLDLFEIQTTNLEELVTHKAKEAYRHVKQPVLVEDTALTFHALGALPGPFIKFFLQELQLQGLCRILDPFKDRSATATALFGLTYDGETVHLFRGDVKGTITMHPVGDGGFGWNPVFQPEGSDKTFAEMNLEEVKPYNHRAKAIEKLQKYLKENER